MTVSPLFSIQEIIYPEGIFFFFLNNVFLYMYFTSCMNFYYTLRLQWLEYTDMIVIVRVGGSALNFQFPLTDSDSAKLFIC